MDIRHCQRVMKICRGRLGWEAFHLCSHFILHGLPGGDDGRIHVFGELVTPLSPGLRFGKSCWSGTQLPASARMMRLLRIQRHANTHE